MKNVLLLALLALASCTTTPHTPDTEPSPTPSALPSPIPSGSPSFGFTDPVPMGQKLKIYYAEDPSTAKKGYGDLNVYDQDVRIFPQYRAKLAGLIQTTTGGTYNCGYIALGYSRGGKGGIHVAEGQYVHSLTTQAVTQLALDWLSIRGVNCVFLDMAGDDYAYDSKGAIYNEDGSDRDGLTSAQESAALASFHQRQVDVGDFLRAQKVVAMWNAWEAETLPLDKFGSSDWVLFEDAEGDKKRGYDRWDYWQKHRPKGSRAYACTAGSYDKASIEAALIKYGVSGVQYKTNEQYENED